MTNSDRDQHMSDTSSKKSKALSALPGVYLLLLLIGLVMGSLVALPFLGFAHDLVDFALIGLPLLLLGIALLAVLFYRIRRDWVEPFIVASNWSAKCSLSVYKQKGM